MANKRLKVKHDKGNNNDSDIAWTDADDDEVEFVGEHIQDDSDEIEFVGEVRREKGTRTVPPKVEKIIPVDEPSFNDVLKHFRWENRSFKLVIASLVRNAILTVLFIGGKTSIRFSTFLWRSLSQKVR